MKGRSNKLIFAGCELLCLLAFAALILPLGDRFHLYPSESVQGLRFVYLGQYLLILCLFYLICFYPRLGKTGTGVVLGVLALASLLTLKAMFNMAYYWNIMLECGFSDEAAVLRRFTACFVFTLLSIAGLALWSVLLYLRRRKLAAGNGDADA